MSLLYVFPVWFMLVRGDGESHFIDSCNFSSEEVFASMSSSWGADRDSAAVTLLLTIVRQLDWAQVIFITDEGGDSWGGANWFLSELSVDFRKFSVFLASGVWTARGLPAIIKRGQDSASHSLNIVLVCNLACVTSVLDGAQKFEAELKSQTALREKSKWLVYPTDVINATWLNMRNVTMNNVAILTIRSLEEVNLCTLMWRKGGRELQPVGGYNRILSADTDVVFPNLQFEMNGRLLRVGMNTWIRFTVDQGENSTTVYGGFDMLLLETLAQLLNFTYEVVLPPDKAWGTRRSDGNWTGLIGMLQRQEVDVVLQPFERTLVREKVMDFSSPLDVNINTFVYRKKPPSSYGLMTFFKPLRMETVGTVFAAMLGTAILVFVTEFHPELAQFLASPGSTPCRVWTRRFQECLKFSFGALLLKSYEGSVRTLSGRTVVSFWWLFCMVVAAAYTGNLVAFLAVSREEVPISSLDHLASQSRYTWGTLGSASIQAHLQESNETLHRRIWEGIQRFSKNDPDVLSTDDSVHIRKVLRENYIFLASSETLENWLTRYCELAMNKKGFGSGISAVMFQKNSTYEPMFSRKILDLHESGLWEELERKGRQQSQSSLCPSPPSSSTQTHPASLADMQGALYMLLAGATTAALVLVIETVVCRCQKRQKEDEEERGSERRRF